MAQVTDERLADLIRYHEMPHSCLSINCGECDMLTALRELVKRRAKLAGVEAVLPKRSGRFAQVLVLYNRLGLPRVLKLTDQSICEHGAYADFCGPCAVRACEAIHAVLSASDSKEG